MSTPYHAKLLALELTRRAEFGTPEILARALSDAQVDLNPHQVDAALFAARSPISKGAILADEVGLGKTIEAALLLAQRWAERRRKLLVIVPANLRKQWSQELREKFHLPSIILERKSIQLEAARGNFNPFNQSQIVIVSYPFAAKSAGYIKGVQWDMVVIDEAHRLRNVYKPASKHANAIKSAVADYFKVLLTATPLQNSLMELYGLVSVIDEFYFASPEGFRERYAKGGLSPTSATELKERLQLVCKRTLRNDVRQFVKFTQRRALVQEFEPNPDETKLYSLVSDYLQLPTLFALPNQQRQLMTMVLRKLLASSTFAISNTLEGMCRKLEELIARKAPDENLPDGLAEDIDKFDETQEEWEEEEDRDEDDERTKRILTPEEVKGAQAELEILRGFWDLAKSIKRNSKGEVLINALNLGFQKATEAQAAQPSIQKKAIIFTESRRTQEYLRDILDTDNTGFKGKVVLFNGSNSDPKAKSIYEHWQNKNRGTDQISDSKTADMRAALVDHFRNDAEIMIATEAAAEGINLQFCNLVVNYDLPWNPQRIEQRIGRCHRYGQKCDVVVVNFVNKKNAADKRVYELLQSKFSIFESVFGASDEVLGLIDATGISFEKRISGIYQACRSTDEIQNAFVKLEQDLESEISKARSQARIDLMANFDQSVVEKIRLDAGVSLDFVSKKLWRLTRHVLRNDADFEDNQFRFILRSPLVSVEKTPPGVYELKKTGVEVMHHVYRIGHPLAEYVLDQGLNAPTPVALVEFDLTRHESKIAVLAKHVGSSGWLRLSKLSFRFRDNQAEEHLVLVGIRDDGTTMDLEAAKALFDLIGRCSTGHFTQTARDVARLDEGLAVELESKKLSLGSRNTKFLREEMAKLESWENDQRAKFRIHSAKIDEQLRDLNRTLGLTEDISVSLDLEMKKIRLLANLDQENLRYTEQCRELGEKKLGLIQERKAQLRQVQSTEHQFALRWTLV